MNALTQQDVGAIVDASFAILASCGIFKEPVPPFEPDLYEAAQGRIEPHFEVPQTTISPLMRRFLFHVARVATPQFIYGAGTYVGFAFAWLISGRQARDGDFNARGVDCDEAATVIARRNMLQLETTGTLDLRVADALIELESRRDPIDLLFIDVDAVDTRKSMYTDILERAKPHLRPGALVLAHDPLVPAFKNDFQRFFAYIEEQDCFGPNCVLPLDDCGISVTVVR
jgi:predicted O-methyltransferase YrrM